MIGARFGAWLVIGEATTQGRKRRWSCRCNCGVERDVQETNLRVGGSTNCGCLRRLKPVNDLIGRRFGRLLVVESAPRTGCGRTRWRCQCDCGTLKDIQGCNLANGVSRSCGCWNSEVAQAKATHGHSRVGKRSPTYSSWAAMVKRCTNPRSKTWDLYGGRGIKVCERWRTSFEAFLSDMGERAAGYSIERIDNNCGYEPGNCKWIPLADQSKNRRPYSEWSTR